MKNFKTSNRLQAVPEQFFAKLEQKVKKAASNADRPIINLGQGSPGEPAFDHIKEALKEAADKPINDKYPPFPGFAYAREACAEFYKREYGVEIDPEKEVSLLIGGKAGLVELPQCLLNPGDIALVPDPGYPDYWSARARRPARPSPSRSARRCAGRSAPLARSSRRDRRRRRRG